MGLDATNKWDGETQREWGTPITMDADVRKRVDALWEHALRFGKPFSLLMIDDDNFKINSVRFLIFRKEHISKH